VSGDAFDNLLQENNIEDNRIGIKVSNGAEAFVAMNTFRRNEVRGNSEIDCIDMTTGTGTSGTANKWESNQCSTCFPAGLCAD
jgi:parallel beta-helix repeat protein